MEEQLKAWLAGAQGIVDKYMREQFPNNPRPTLEMMPGKRYIRVVSKEPGHTYGSAWAFIDTTNGDVLKPASYKAPAKHARGNLNDEHKGLGHIGPYGPAYLR